MEDKEESHLENPPLDLSEIKKEVTEKTIEKIDPNDLKKIVNDSNEVITDLFYKSIKLFFDVGFDLANKLNLEMLDLIKKEKTKEKDKE
jgi:hypothetical protein